MIIKPQKYIHVLTQTLCLSMFFFLYIHRKKRENVMSETNIQAAVHFEKKASKKQDSESLKLKNTEFKSMKFI